VWAEPSIGIGAIFWAAGAMSTASAGITGLSVAAPEPVDPGGSWSGALGPGDNEDRNAGNNVWR
jgi:hypothetical protein